MLESKLRVHDMVSIGDGQQTLVFPAEQEKLVESFTEQVSKNKNKYSMSRATVFGIRSVETLDSMRPSAYVRSGVTEDREA